MLINSPYLFLHQSYLLHAIDQIFVFQQAAYE